MILKKSFMKDIHQSRVCLSEPTFQTFPHLRIANLTFKYRCRFWVRGHVARMREQRHNPKNCTFQEKQNKFSIYIIFTLNLMLYAHSGGHF